MRNKGKQKSRDKTEQQRVRKNNPREGLFLREKGQFKRNTSRGNVRETKPYTALCFADKAGSKR